jgi:prolyl oligopeptidase
MSVEHTQTAPRTALPDTPLDPATDPFAWLEDVDGETALSWVRERNAHSAQVLGGPAFTETERAVREVLDSDDKIPHVSKVGEHYYNFWQDAEHERGLWRRTTLDSNRAGTRWSTCRPAGPTPT